MRALLVVCLLLGACAPVTADRADSDGGGEVQLDAERVSASAVRLTLRNGSNQNVGFNLCVSALERQSGQTWQHVPTRDACTMQLGILSPGQTATFTKQLPAVVPAGEYRYVTQVEMPLGARQVRIPSDSFRL